MKTLAPLFLAGLLAPALTPAPVSQDPAPKEKRGNPVTRFFEGEIERLASETEGSWMLIDYSDPQVSVGIGAASGFLTFHDGFLTMILAVDAIESRLFLAGETTLLQTGAYRYRFDERGALQLASVVAFTNQTEDGEVDHEPANSVYEYFARLDDNVLELRNKEGVALGFRRVTSGEFPEAAIRKLESQRSGDQHWDLDDEPR